MIPVIARLVLSDEDRVREMSHRFSDLGVRPLDPQRAGDHPRQITTEDEAFITETAKTPPEKLDQPFTRWSIRTLVDYLADNPDRRPLRATARVRGQQLEPPQPHDPPPARH